MSQVVRRGVPNQQAIAPGSTATSLRLAALGGMAAAGILAMFVGATLLALGYQIFVGWVAACGEAKSRGQEQDKPT
jgi:hypothetical protein